MTFKFKLESLLSHRKRIKDEAQREHIEAQSLVDQCLEQIQHMYQQMDISRDVISQTETSAGSSQLATILSSHEFIEGQKIVIERKRQEARELMAVAEQKLEALVQASQDFEALKKLKEKKKISFQLKKKKKEAQGIDDLVTMRFKRSVS